jgi:hypothetical protein
MAKNAGGNVVTAWCFGGGDVVHGSVILRGWKCATFRHLILIFDHE